MVARVIYSALYFDSHSFCFPLLFFLVMSYCLFSSQDFFLTSVTNQKHKKSRVADFSLLHVWKISSLLEPATPPVKKQKGKEPEVWTIKPRKSLTHQVCKLPKDDGERTIGKSTIYHLLEERKAYGEVIQVIGEEIGI